MSIPMEITLDWVKMSESVLEKCPTLGSKIGQIFGSLVYQVESLQTPGHDIGKIFNNL